MPSERVQIERDSLFDALHSLSVGISADVKSLQCRATSVEAVAISLQDYKNLDSDPHSFIQILPVHLTSLIRSAWLAGIECKALW